MHYWNARAGWQRAAMMGSRAHEWITMGNLCLFLGVIVVGMDPFNQLAAVRGLGCYTLFGAHIDLIWSQNLDVQHRFSAVSWRLLTLGSSMASGWCFTSFVFQKRLIRRLSFAVGSSIFVVEDVAAVLLLIHPSIHLSYLGDWLRDCNDSKPDYLWFERILHQPLDKGLGKLLSGEEQHVYCLSVFSVFQLNKDKKNLSA